MCYSCNSYFSLRNIKKAWVPEAKELNPKVPLLLVGTKADLYEEGNDTHVPPKLALTTCTKVKAISTVRTSALLYSQSNQTKGNVDVVFKQVLRAGLKAVGVIETRTPWYKKKCGLF